MRESGERCDAHGTLASESGDPRRIVLTDDLQSAGELVDEDVLRFDAVALFKALVVEGHRRDHGRTVVRR